jgi:hypothetical protein
VRHTKAASHSLRTISKIIVEDYDSVRVAASSDIEILSHGDIRICQLFSAYPRNVLANLPKAATTTALAVYELRSSLRLN